MQVQSKHKKAIASLVVIGLLTLLYLCGVLYFILFWTLLCISCVAMILTFMEIVDASFQNVIVGGNDSTPKGDVFSCIVFWVCGISCYFLGFNGHYAPSESILLRAMANDFYNDGTPCECDSLKRSYHDNGILESELPYVNGEKNGVEKGYDWDGKLFTKTPYVNGKINGTVWVFYPNGSVKEVEIYNSGVYQKTYSDDYHIRRLLGVKWSEL